MKFCKDCLYFTEGNWCHAPQNGLSMVTGKSIVRFASTNRDEATPVNPITKIPFVQKCGEEGLWFKEKTKLNTHVPEKEQPWYKFWSIFYK